MLTFHEAERFEKEVQDFHQAQIESTKKEIQATHEA